MNILQQIINDKIVEVQEQKKKEPLENIKKKITIKKKIFSQRLVEFEKKNHPAIIAEIKKASPSKGVIKENFNHLQIAKEYVEANAACLSVLTEKKYFLGDKKFINEIKNKFNIPILNKDFFVDPYQVYEANKNGADCVLIIINSSSDNLIKDLSDTSLELGMDFILEVHNEKEMEKALNYENSIIGINNRNLENFNVSIDNTIKIFKQFETALKDRLIISESGFNKKEDLQKVKDETGINNFLIGESLMKSDSIKECFKNFII